MRLTIERGAFGPGRSTTAAVAEARGEIAANPHSHPSAAPKGAFACRVEQNLERRRR